MSEDTIFDIWVKRGKNNKFIAGVLILTAVAASALSLITAAKAFFPNADPNLNYLRAYGTIDFPKNGGSIRRNFVASGTAGKAEKGVYLWLTVEIDGRIWPKERGVFVDNGGWRLESSEKGHPDQFELSLWAANPKANNHLEVWREHCVETGDCPGWRPPADMKLLWRVEGLHLASGYGERSP